MLQEDQLGRNEEDRDLKVREAEWVWSEMKDFVNQIQKYRLSYVTALFASIGWILGQLVNPQNSGTTLANIRQNAAVATIVLLVPVLNSLFFLLVMEAARQVQSLARYRFLLACELGGEPPVWRWELFKTTPEGSIRHWTNPSNIFLGVFALGTSVGAFIFVNPAVGNAWVNVVRWFSASFTVALAIAVLWAAWPRRYRNEVADRPSRTTYRSLKPEWVMGSEHSSAGSASSDARQAERALT